MNNKKDVQDPASNPPLGDIAILTVDELASLLKMSRQQIYEQTRHRARVRQPIPLPFVRINGNLRFRRSDIAAWLNQLAEYEKGRRIQ